MKFSEKSDRYRLNGGTGVVLYLVLLMFHSWCLYSPSPRPIASLPRPQSLAITGGYLS